MEQGLSWLVGTQVFPIWVKPELQTMEEISPVLVKEPLLQLNVAVRFWFPPVMEVVLLAEVADPPLVAGTLYPSMVVVVQFRLQADPVRVAVD